MPRSSYEIFPSISISELSDAELFALVNAHHAHLDFSPAEESELPPHAPTIRSLGKGYTRYLRAFSLALAHQQRENMMRPLNFSSQTNVNPNEAPVTFSLSSSPIEPNAFFQLDDTLKETIADQLTYYVSVNPVVIINQLAAIPTTNTHERQLLVENYGSDVVRALAMYAFINRIYALYPQVFFRHDQFAILEDVVRNQEPELPKNTSIGRHVAHWQTRYRAMMKSPRSSTR